MQAFNYTAYTQNGQRRRGTLVAESERAVHKMLAARGLWPETIERGQPQARRLRSRRLDTAQQGIFLRQMAILLGAELSIDAALETIQAGVKATPLHRLCADLRAATSEGQSLADAVEQTGAKLPPSYSAAIRAGEKVGTLPAVFERLADFHEAQDETRASLATALIYPGLVAAVSFLVCIVLITQVAPQLVDLFASTGQDLPAITTALLTIADWVTAHRRSLGLVFAVLFGAAAFGATQIKVRDRAAQWALRLPVLGALTELRAAATYLRTFALVLQSHGTPVSALGSAAGVLPISTMRRSGQDAAQAMREGTSLAQAMAAITLLPPIARHLIETGDATARLGPMADRAATLVEGMVTRQQKRLIAVLDPLLMMIVGAMVLIVVLAVLLPIFDLQSAIQL